MAACETYVKKTSQIDITTIWHAWSGYLGYQMLMIISSKKLLGLPALKHVQEDMICKGCQYGKAHLLPFKSSSKRKTNCFRLIHAILMGPTRTSSYSGYHYTMLFLDDHSRCNLVFFLRRKLKHYQSLLSLGIM